MVALFSSTLRDFVSATPRQTPARRSLRPDGPGEASHEHDRDGRAGPAVRRRLGPARLHAHRPRRPPGRPAGPERRREDDAAHRRRGLGDPLVPCAGGAGARRRLPRAAHWRSRAARGRGRRPVAAAPARHRPGRRGQRPALAGGRVSRSGVAANDARPPRRTRRARAGPVGSPDGRCRGARTGLPAALAPAGVGRLATLPDHPACLRGGPRRARGVPAPAGPPDPGRLRSRPSLLAAALGQVRIRIRRLPRHVREQRPAALLSCSPCSRPCLPRSVRGWTSRTSARRAPPRAGGPPGPG